VSGAQERAIRSLEAADEVAAATPTAFLVETRGASIADRAGEPSYRMPLRGKARLRISDQLLRNALPARCGRDVELIKLVGLQQMEAEWRANRSDHPQVGLRVAEAPGETAQRTRPRQCFGHDGGMGILPAVMPEAGQRIDFAAIGRSDAHDPPRKPVLAISSPPARTCDVRRGPWPQAWSTLRRRRRHSQRRGDPKGRWCRPRQEPRS